MGLQLGDDGSKANLVAEAEKMPEADSNGNSRRRQSL